MNITFTKEGITIDAVDGVQSFTFKLKSKKREKFTHFYYKRKSK